MSKRRIVAQQALDALMALEGVGTVVTWEKHRWLCYEAIAALRQALEDKQQYEPVAGAVLNEEGQVALVNRGDEEWHVTNYGATRLYARQQSKQGIGEE